MSIEEIDKVIKALENAQAIIESQEKLIKLLKLQNSYLKNPVIQYMPQPYPLFYPRNIFF